jgi:hypothetical protein
MLSLMRMLFTVGWWFCMFKAGDVARSAGNDNLCLLYFIWALILSLPTSALWAPLIASMLCGSLAGIMGDDASIEPNYGLMSLIEWARERNCRSLVVLLCVIKAFLEPDLPSAFLLGMEYTKRGSWLERFFAEQIFRFDNTQNCVKAAEVLKRHGVNPGRHPNPEVNLLLSSASRKTAMPSASPPSPVVPPKVGKKTTFKVPTIGKNGTQRLPQLGDYRIAS